MALSMSQLRRIVRPFVPKPILRIREHLIWARIRQQYGQLSVAEAFAQTYSNKLWGGIEGNEFFSGFGSLDKFATPYVEWLTGFIVERGIKNIVDLGCGDFQIGQKICSANSVNFIGVDIVPDLIESNQSRYANATISFTCADIIEDELPDGDICLIRQVLQHLSNSQISRVLANCSKFPYLVVTEDIYCGRRMRPNVDIIHGPDNRLHKRSGVFLDKAPFCLETESVLEIPCPEFPSLIRTSLIDRARKQQLKDCAGRLGKLVDPKD
jgi:hypothetical protein